ncbi:MAG: alpha/beta fold hydrolase [Actinobacteria bacterium]|nr:MAG: alpha/beta fold hydrolase [Actinomycetota bacterium]
MPYATSGQARIAYATHGPESSSDGAETLLLIMGLGGSGAMWWRLLPHLAREHRVITLDNRGTGESSAATGPLTMGVMANDAIAVLDAAGVAQAHVVGASMGGMVAQHVALDHRDRVRSLALACTTAGGPSGPPNLRLLAATFLRPLVGPQRTSPLVAPALYSDRTRHQRPALMAQDLARRLRDRVGLFTPWAQMAAIARHDTRARLGELADLGVLVLHGTEDRLVPVDRGRALARAIPGARLVEFPDTGHILSTDAEDEVAAALLGHVARHARGGGRRAPRDRAAAG